MRVRALLAAALACLSVMAPAQTIVMSPAPDKVAVTVYRAQNASGTMDLEWLQGFAIVRETRRISLPAGESELRFEGVASGIIPQSAIVEGLGDVVEKKSRGRGKPFYACTRFPDCTFVINKKPESQEELMELYQQWKDNPPKPKKPKYPKKKAASAE